jgi:hypothetical protein
MEGVRWARGDKGADRKFSARLLLRLADICGLGGARLRFRDSRCDEVRLEEEVEIVCNAAGAAWSLPCDEGGCGPDMVVRDESASHWQLGISEWCSSRGPILGSDARCDIESAGSGSGSGSLV